MVGRHSLKKDLQALMDYQVRQVVKNNVEIKMETEVDIGMINKDRPEVVFLATGSIPLQELGIQGVETVRAFSPTDILGGGVDVGNSVVVIGGGSTGCEIGYELADGKTDVTVCEQLSELATDLFKANRDMLFELLKDRGVKTLTNCRVERVSPGKVIYQLSSGRRGEIKADSIILAAGRQSVSGLLSKMDGLEKECYAIGDCLSPRKVKDAIWEAYKRAIKV